MSYERAIELVALISGKAFNYVSRAIEHVWGIGYLQSPPKLNKALQKTVLNKWGLSGAYNDALKVDVSKTGDWVAERLYDYESEVLGVGNGRDFFCDIPGQELVEGRAFILVAEWGDTRLDKESGSVDIEATIQRYTQNWCDGGSYLNPEEFEDFV